VEPSSLLSHYDDARVVVNVARFDARVQKKLADPL
jgi:hypothetical protein